MSLSSLPGMTGLQLDLDVSDPVVIYKHDKVLKYGRGTHITMAEVSTNRIALSYFPGGEGSSGLAALPWPIYSDDKGKSWQFGDPFNLNTNETSYTPFIPEGMGYNSFRRGTFFSPSVAPNGRRTLFTFLAEERYGMTREMIYSDDDGKTWHGPVKSHFVFDESVYKTPKLLASGRSAVVTTNGTILHAIYGGHSKKPPWRTYLFKSEDGGLTFTYVSMIAIPEDLRHSTDGPCEPDLIMLPDGELLCIMRTGARAGTAGISLNASADLMLEARSRDGGLTWKTSYTSVPGVMPRILRMKNGVMVLATGRPGNRIYFSLDDGRSWRREINLTTINRIITSGYVDLMEVEPGRIMVTYDTVDAPIDRFWSTRSKKYNAMMAVFIDVKKRF